MWSLGYQARSRKKKLQFTTSNNLPAPPPENGAAELRGPVVVSNHHQDWLLMGGLPRSGWDLRAGERQDDRPPTETSDRRLGLESGKQDTVIIAAVSSAEGCES